MKLYNVAIRAQLPRDGYAHTQRMERLHKRERKEIDRAGNVKHEGMKKPSS